MAQVELTKAAIIDQAHKFGAEFVGFAPVDRWVERGDVPAAYHPHKIWPQAKTVIVLGIPLWLPGLEAAPTVLGREQHTVTSELLDEAAYRLAVYLNKKGYPSVNIPQDANGEDMSDCPTVVVFSHVWAGYYAALGQVGQDNIPLNLVSVLTALEMESD